VELISAVTDKKGRHISKETTTLTINGGETVEVSQMLTIPNPTLWSIENPYLYTVTTQLKRSNQCVDEYETPMGIRSFSFDAEKGFLLNGKSVKIKGVCQHHDLGCLGSAVNTRALERQLEILKEMGCNGIRTSHNPPAPELLDLCDKMGFIVMDEAFDMWMKKKTTYDYAHDFSEWFEKDLTDWVLRDRNHPSVFMWSVGNEVLEQWTDINADTLDLQQANILFNFASSLSDAKLSSEELHVNSLLAAKLADIVKKLDPTRPITSANNEVEPNNHVIRSGAMDILGFNYHENRWEYFPQLYPGQRYICTESTSSVMSRGYYEMPSDSVLIRPNRWDRSFVKEGNQCSAYDNSRVPWGSTHELSWRLTKQYDFMSGLYIWTGFDYLGEPTPYSWPSRSSYFGIIDLAGFPKDVYYMYQSEWTDQPVLHLFPHWNWKEGETVDVWAYYNNADEVELFLNEKSLGKKSKKGDELHVWWRVSYEKGTLKAISRKDGKTVLEKEIQTTGEPVALRLTADRSTISADGKDLAFITVEAVDINGLPVPVAQNRIAFSIEGNGTIVGTDNGDPTGHLSLKAPERSLFNGKALVVLQSTGQSGNMVLKAQSEGLTETKLRVETR
jgi:beta-galactosidase